MTETEIKLLNILQQSPKTWRELIPDFPDRDEMNRALLVLERNDVITYDLKKGLYRAV